MCAACQSFTFRLTKCSITQAGPPNAVLARVVNSAKSQEIGLSEPLQDLREGKPYKTASLCLVQSQKVTMLRNFWAMFHGFPWFFLTGYLLLPCPAKAMSFDF